MAEAGNTSEARAALSRELGFGDVASADVADCQVVELCVALHEAERGTPGLSHRLESWPPAPRMLIEREAEAWHQRRPDRVVRMVSTAVARGCCVMVLHHADRNSAG